MPPNILYLITNAAAILLGAGMMYLYKNNNGQGQQKGQTDTCLAACTCGQEKMSCEKYDAQLINEISKVITRSETLVDLGILLGVKTSIIETIQEDNTGSIDSTAFKLLNRWYQETDGLRSESKGLAKLRKCLKKVGLERNSTEIMEQHFHQ